MSNPKCPHCNEDITYVEVTDIRHGILKLLLKESPTTIGLERTFFCPKCDKEIDKDFVNKAITPCKHEWRTGTAEMPTLNLNENEGTPVTCILCGDKGVARLLSQPNKIER